MITSPFADSGLWQSIGWSMLHLSWIGVLIGTGALLTRPLIRKLSPQLRYAAALGWLTLLAIAPLPVGWWVWSTRSNTTSRATEPEFAAATVTETTIARIDEALAKSFSPPTLTPTETDRKSSSIVAPAAEPDIERPKLTTIPSKSHEPAESFVAESSTAVLDSEWPSSPRPPIAGSAELVEGPSPRLATNDENRFMDYAATQLESLAGTLPWLWFIGTPATFLLLATGLLGAERLRRQSQPFIDDVLNTALARFSAQLGLRVKVTVGICDRIAGPILVGIVRPMILLPAAAVCQWTPGQLEMVLWHELSHIRRWDNLVNLVQRIVESLLFFVPAVWFVSRWVRLEREHCCDHCVVAQTGKPREYAQTLVQLADRRLPQGARKRATVSKLLTSPMAEHVLLVRVRQILKSEEEPMKISRTLFGSVVILIAAMFAFAGWYGTTSTTAQEPSSENDVKAESKEFVTELQEAGTKIQPVNASELNLESAPEPKSTSGEFSKGAATKSRQKRTKDDNDTGVLAIDPIQPVISLHSFTVRFAEDITVSAERLGVLGTVDVADGATAEKGATLATYTKTGLEQAELDLKIADLKWKSAVKKSKEMSALAESAVIGSHQLEDAKLAAELAALEVRKETLKLETISKPIVAPISGMVVRIFKRPAETVNPGDPVFRIVNTDKFVVEGNLNLQASGGKIPRTGEPFLFVVSGYGLKPRKSVFDGKIEHVATELTQGEDKIEIRGSVANQDGLLRSGMRGTVTLYADNSQADVARRSLNAPVTKYSVVRMVGFTFTREKPQSSDEIAETRFRGGLEIGFVDPDGPAAMAGIRDGDILVGLDKWETLTADNVRYVFEQREYKSSEPMKFYILRNHVTLQGQLTFDDSYTGNNMWRNWRQRVAAGNEKAEQPQPQPAPAPAPAPATR